MVDQALNWLRKLLSKIPKHVRQNAISVFGLIALTSPLLLWATWSPLSFRVVLYGSLTALLLIYLLIWSSPDDDL